MTKIVKWFGCHADAGLPSLQYLAGGKVLFEVLRGDLPGAQAHHHVDDEGNNDQYVDGMHWVCSR